MSQVSPNSPLPPPVAIGSFSETISDDFKETLQMMANDTWKGLKFEATYWGSDDVQYKFASLEFLPQKGKGFLGIVQSINLKYEQFFGTQSKASAERPERFEEVLLKPTPVTSTPVKRKGISRHPNFVEDLTKQAEKGTLRKGHFREDDIHNILRLLRGATLSTVLVYGATGCGKTALVETLAKMIVDKQVPPEFQGRKVLFLPGVLGLKAGTEFRGAMEERLLDLMKYAETHADEVIVVMDEVYDSVRSRVDGTTKNPMTIMDSLKSYLDRPTFPLIAMTTDVEWKMMGDDPSIGPVCRRFKPYRLEGLSIEQTIASLALDRAYFEAKFPIHMDDACFKAVTFLSYLYDTNEGLPSGPYKLLDQVCSQYVETKDEKAIIGEEDVIKFCSRHYKKGIDQVRSDLQGSQNDPSIHTIPKGATLFKYVANLSRILYGETAKKGHKAEWNQILEALSGSTHNVVVVAGEKGVGKTALIHRLAHQSDEMPAVLKKRVLLKLDLEKVAQYIKAGSLTHAALIELLKEYSKHFVLYIDHPPAVDILTLLRPLVDSGELLLVIESDAPLFAGGQKTVEVAPLSAFETAEILKAERKAIEARAQTRFEKPVTLTDGAIEEAVEKASAQGSLPLSAFKEIDRMISQIYFKNRESSSIHVEGTPTLKGRIYKMVSGWLSMITGLFRQYVYTPFFGKR